MKRKILLLIFIFQLSVNLCSQTTKYPKIGSQDGYTLEIESIEITKTQTIIYFKHTAPSLYQNGGWVSINPDIYIVDKSTYKKLSLIQAEGIPISPEKHNYQYKGQTLSFRLIFPAISADCKKIDIVECPTSKDCFNFYNVEFNHEVGENNNNNSSDKFRRDYDYVAFYNPTTSSWTDWAKGTNTFVFNINENSDMKIYYSDGKSETFRRVSGVAEDKTEKGMSYQATVILDYEGTEIILQLFDNGDTKLIYPSGFIVQFTNSSK